MTPVADRLYRVVLGAVTLLLGVLTVVVSYQVMGRYLPFVPRALWTEEIARLCLEWLVFLGAALAVRRNEHFIIDVVPARFEPRVRRPLQIVILVFLTIATVAILVGGLGFAQTGADRTSTTSGIQLVWAFSAVPVSAAVTLVFIAELAQRTLRGESVAEFGDRLVAETAVTSDAGRVEGAGE